MTTKHRPVVILLVEDNPDHALLIKKALRGNGVANEIRLLATGEEALDYLFRRGPYADPASSPRPGLILLDIKLPGVDGVEVLREVKQDARLRLVPVVMLTTSASEEEVVASYGLGANSYIQKPVDFEKFVQTVKGLRLYWLLVNTPPPDLG
jgi:two-component system response regulator